MHRSIGVAKNHSRMIKIVASARLAGLFPDQPRRPLWSDTLWSGTITIRSAFGDRYRTKWRNDTRWYAICMVCDDVWWYLWYVMMCIDVQREIMLYYIRWCAIVRDYVRWYVSIYNLRWHALTCDDMWWCLIICGDIRWYTMIIDDVRWYAMMSNGMRLSAIQCDDMR